MRVAPVLNRAVPYLYIAPAAVVLAAAAVYPLALSAELAFYEWGLGTPWSSARWLGFEAYTRMAEDDAVWTSVGVTLAFCAIIVAAEMLIGTALALLLEKPVRGMAVFRTIFVLPFMIAPIVVGLVWRYLFDAQYGLINYFVSLAGIAPQAWLADPQLAFLALVITDIWQWTPFVFIMVVAGLQGLDSAVMEAARIDGANAWQTTVSVKLPMLAPVLLVTLLMRLIDGFRGLETMFVMTFGGPGLSTEVLSLHIYKVAFIAQKLGYASALSNLLLLIVMALALALLAVANPMKRNDGA
jgi:multiple sugar transport system permease protein